MTNINIKYLTPEQYAPSVVDEEKYTDLHKLDFILDKTSFRTNLLLSGPKGTGKSLALARYAYKNNIPIITFDCSEDVRRHHLYGMFVLEGEVTSFVLGALTAAIQLANDAGKAMLVLEEINALAPESQKLLNPLLDFRRKIDLPEVGKVYQLNSGAQLWVTGTMNQNYGGVFELNEDLKSRCRIYPVEYPNKKEEINLLKKYSKQTSLIETLATLAGETRTDTFSYSLSTRDLVQILEDAEFIDKETALRLACGKFDSSERVLFNKRVKSITGLDL